MLCVVCPLLFALVLYSPITHAPRTTLRAQQIDSSYVSQFRYRYIGIEGNRVTAVEGIPGNPLRTGASVR